MVEDRKAPSCAFAIAPDAIMSYVVGVSAWLGTTGGRRDMNVLHARAMSVTETADGSSYCFGTTRARRRGSSSRSFMGGFSNRLC
jgi:hypothetical protein